MWIMESILIFLVVTLMMSSPASGYSQSMSCSTVNGKMVCEKQANQGNSALAFGGAAIGSGGQTYQDAYAGAGNPGQSWDYGRQTVYGNTNGQGAPPQGNAPGPNYGPTGSSSSVFTSSSTSDNNPGQGGFAGGFVSTGNFPAGGGAFPFGGPGAAAGGFATSGVFPFGGGNPPQQPDAPNQGQPPQQGFDPFMYVRPFFGQGGPAAFAGGFAGFPFGRR